MESAPTQPKPEWKTWNIIYPLYMNAKKTEAEGRRIGRLRAVDNPTCNEISEACKKLNFASYVESDKNHPRDHARLGRVRVNIKGSPSPCSKISLMWNISAEIKKLPKRAASEPAPSATAPSAAGNKKAAATGKKKKK